MSALKQEPGLKGAAAEMEGVAMGGAMGARVWVEEHIPIAAEVRNYILERWNYGTLELYNFRTLEL